MNREHRGTAREGEEEDVSQYEEESVETQSDKSEGELDSEQAPEGKQQRGMSSEEATTSPCTV